VRRAAVEALEAFGDPRAVEPLIGALGDEEVRGAAVGALQAFGDPRAVEPLIGALGDKRPWVRLKVVEALQAFGDPRAVEPLIGALGDEGVRDAVVRALQAFGDPRAVEALFGALFVDLDDGKRAEDAMVGLVSALERSSQGIGADVLRRVCKLKDEVSYSYYYPPAQCIGNPNVSGVISCSRVKQLARQELVRRGLRA